MDIMPFIEDDCNNWKLVFNDEFEGKKIDTLKWDIRFPDLDLTQYIHPGDEFGYSGENVSVSDSCLRIKAERNPITVNDVTANYRSGIVTTKNKYYQKFGYFEAKIKMPECNGPIPAFWMMPEHLNGVYSMIGMGGQGAEIDIMEHLYIWDDKVQSGIHWGGYGLAHVCVDKLFGNVKNPTDWHIYGLDWNDAKYDFYVDGILKTTYSGEGVSKGREFLILSMAVGGWGGIPDDEKLPQYMLVDWVRCYTKD